ncbi:WhiB family transcriptional regulator [Pseudonocardia sp. KRD-184]|uniref:WhiB family transcriptional regulator n=2 Tax=Pseudonocardia oceani TaxID=2792013 RepID=A0ABS6U941_9PSEU|nr:WhiB family transcriptional regulator [Pseudonocardia oceani]MBW0096905.1 WhiB family transcriptional regulator [Pseudonocardia oceani]MBW0123720.1 WhiB family transcriptional regulator [Pseudonocardia oceani]MBW0128503.1 WhiB family transcriptional regulator [Pseudonocardia oceani]
MTGHLRPEDFRHRAACRSVDPEIFFPTAVAGPEFEAQVSLAKTVCEGCPVREHCLTWALTHQPDGIAGAMTEHERRQELARRRVRRRGRLPRPRTPQRPVSATRAEVAEAGRAAIAAGMSVRDAAGELLVSVRTAGRWARAIHRTTSPQVGKGSTGGHRAPLRFSHTATQAGTRAEGPESR